MKTKKGFTLVELLAVIAILAILVIIALPNVMGMFRNAKKNSFITEVKEIYKTAESTWMSDSMFDTNEKAYSRCTSGCSNPLDLSGREELEYYIKLDKAGKVTDLYATDGTYQYSYEGGNLKIEDIKEAKEIAKISESEKIDISQKAASIGGSSSSYIVCNGGEYLPKGSNSCVACTAGSYCLGGNYSYSESNDQGKIACAQGSYSSAGASQCIACGNGKTTNGSGKTSCNTNCDGYYGTKKWKATVWNDNNIVSDSCIATECQSSPSGVFRLKNNECVATATFYTKSSYTAVNNQHIPNNIIISSTTIDRNYFSTISGVNKTYTHSKIDIVDSIVNAKYVCFSINSNMGISGVNYGEYCLKAEAGNETYQANVNVLKRIFGNNSSYCKETTDKYECKNFNVYISNGKFHYYVTRDGECYAQYDEPVEGGEKPYCKVNTNEVNCSLGGCLDGETEVEVYDKKKKKRKRKKLKDITSDDLIMCWDFDKGEFVFVEPLWIKKVSTLDHYFVLNFSDGSTLKVIGDHKVFDADRNKFVNAGCDNELKIGSHIYNSKGEIVELISWNRVDEKIDAYNVITNYHMNIFANGILTSCVFSNIYDIENMKYVKDSTERLNDNDLDGISEEYVKGLRLNEVPSNFRGSKEATIEYVHEYINKLDNTRK